MKYRAISLHEPHASFIAWGVKPFETRHWEPHYQGELAIHAALRPLKKEDKELLEEIRRSSGLEITVNPGHVVAIVSLGKVFRTESLDAVQFMASNGLGNFTAGRFAWALDNIRRFKNPVPSKGGRKWFSVDVDFSKHPVVSMPYRKAA